MIPSGNGTKPGRAPRQKHSEPGTVFFRGAETLGFQGEATGFVNIHACDECHAARKTLPGHELRGCGYDDAIGGLVRKGLAFTLFRDDIWRAHLTERGVRAFRREAVGKAILARRRAKRRADQRRAQFERDCLSAAG